MNYTNAKYTESGTIQTDGMSVPANAGNRHYAEPSANRTIADT